MGWPGEAGAERKGSCCVDVMLRLPAPLHTARLQAGLHCEMVPALRAAQKQAYALRAATELS